MTLKEMGRYYELPIVGLSIEKLTYTGLMTLIFNDVEQSYLNIDGDFIIKKHNQATQLSPRTKEALILFYDLLTIKIKEAKADKKGNLYIKFQNNFELIIEDGPYENWHFTRIDPNFTKNNLYVHGGVGKTIVLMN